MAGGPLECLKGAPSMDTARETDKERGGGPASVRNFLLVIGAGGFSIQGRDLGFVDENFQEYGGGARGFPQTFYRSEGHVAEVRYLDKRGSVKGTQGSGKSYTGDLH